MKLIHLSDLHFGKIVNGISMLEDQKYIAGQIVNCVREERPDAVLIAGDVYDKGVPPADAVTVLSDFLSALSELRIPVFLSYGNHDSGERMAFLSGIIARNGIFISPLYDGSIKPFTLNDEFGPVDIYMLPFIKPVHVRQAFPDEDTPDDYSGAVGFAIDRMNLDKTRRNVLLSHQFVTGAARSDSETVSVGGTDNVSAEVYKDFDYTALGHIHGPQALGERLRYCGTPLKYSFSELKHKKSITVVELGEKQGEALCDINIRTIPLVPKHDFAEIKGTYDEVMSKEFRDKQNAEDYFKVILTDENDIPDVRNRLATVYPNIMLVEYDNTRTKAVFDWNFDAPDEEKKSPLELVSEHFEMMNDCKMSEFQAKTIKTAMEKIWTEEE